MTRDHYNYETDRLARQATAEDNPYDSWKCWLYFWGVVIVVVDLIAIYRYFEG